MYRNSSFRCFRLLARKGCNRRTVSHRKPSEFILGQLNYYHTSAIMVDFLKAPKGIGKLCACCWKYGDHMSTHEMYPQHVVITFRIIVSKCNKYYLSYLIQQSCPLNLSYVYHKTAVRLEFHHMVKFQTDNCPYHLSYFTL